MRAYRVREEGDAFVLPDDVYGLVRREVLAEVLAKIDALAKDGKWGAYHEVVVGMNKWLKQERE